MCHISPPIFLEDFGPGSTWPQFFFFRFFFPFLSWQSTFASQCHIRMTHFSIVFRMDLSDMLSREHAILNFTLAKSISIFNNWIKCKFYLSHQVELLFYLLYLILIFYLAFTLSGWYIIYLSGRYKVAYIFSTKKSPNLFQKYILAELQLDKLVHASSAFSFMSAEVFFCFAFEKIVKMNILHLFFVKSHIGKIKTLNIFNGTYVTSFSSAIASNNDWMLFIYHTGDKNEWHLFSLYIQRNLSAQPVWCFKFKSCNSYIHIEYIFIMHKFNVHIKSL